MPFKNACKRSQQQCDPRNISTATVARPPKNQNRTAGRAGQRFTLYVVVHGGVNTAMFVFAGAIGTHWADCTALLRVQYPFVLVFFIAFPEMACTWSLSIFRLILMDL